MARDFLTDQTRTGNIIGNNSPDSEPKLIVYSDSNALDNIGGKSTELGNRLNNVGDDAFIYIDGIPGSKKLGTANTVAVFGGDVVVSGSLYSEGNSSSLWEVDPTDSDSLIPTNIIDGHTGLFAMDFNTYIDFDGTVYQNSYTMSVNSCIVDTLFELDTSDQNDLNNIMPKL
tara:strand:+ start:11736 stop:12251 length:516 start_codon:yes stop_codon:yes gene_type:complete